MGDSSAIERIGATLAGKYRLDRVLGEGGMGVVYAATHLRLRQRCAIKMLNDRALQSPEIVSRFEREARAAATLKNPHVVQVLDVDSTTESLPYMVMEFLEGRDLATVLETNGPLPIDEAVRWAIDTCVALAHAHKRGVVHRDLKPSNLFLSEKDGEVTLKLLDFGISKMTDDEASHVTSSIAMFGTPFYMSPEQVRSVRDVDGRTDIWSLGVVLYELLTGRVPFKGVPSAVCAAIVADPVLMPQTLRKDIPDALQAVILKALEKDRTLRWKDARELAEALAPFTHDVKVAEALQRASRASFPDTTLPQTRGSSPTLAYAQTQVEPPTPLPDASKPAPAPKSSGETLGGRSVWSRPPSMPHRRAVWRGAILGGTAVFVVGVAALALGRLSPVSPGPAAIAAPEPPRVPPPAAPKVEPLPPAIVATVPPPSPPAATTAATTAVRAPRAVAAPAPRPSAPPPPRASAAPPPPAPSPPPTLSNPLTL